jgi:hypothetical protein
LPTISCGGCKPRKRSDSASRHRTDSEGRGPPFNSEHHLGKNRPSSPPSARRRGVNSRCRPARHAGFGQRTVGQADTDQAGNERHIRSKTREFRDQYARGCARVMGYYLEPSQCSFLRSTLDQMGGSGGHGVASTDRGEKHVRGAGE